MTPLKAACGITNKAKDPIQDIDAADVDNELAMVEYIDDIYKYYKLTEVVLIHTAVPFLVHV